MEGARCVFKFILINVEVAVIVPQKTKMVGHFKMYFLSHLAKHAVSCKYDP